MRTPATSFEDLVVWQKAHQFALAAYRFSGTFPRSETYGLSSQFRRAAVSIAANIAEGFKKRVAVAAVSDRRVISRNERPAVRDRRYSSAIPKPFRLLTTDR